MKAHPVAETFPLMSEQALQTLADDIRVNGLRLPILVDSQNRIVDGRNRYRACELAGVAPRFESVTDEAALRSLVRSLNYHRRHLTDSQMAAIGVELEMEREEQAARERNAAAGASAAPGRKASQQIDEVSAGRATEKVAAIVGTNRQYVSDAKAIRTADPVLFERVKAGETKIPEAKRILKQRRREQQLIEQEPATIEADSSLLHADCRDVEWPKDINLIIADPPFGLSQAGSSGVRTGKGDWDEWSYSDLHAFNLAWLSPAIDALHQDGSILVFGSVHNIWSIGHALKERGLYIVRDIVWEKPFTQSAPNMSALVPSHELIIWARKGTRSTCNLTEITRDVWRDIAPQQKHAHPTEKPEKLIARLIDMCSNPGDLVADPFVGSGTTTAIAKQLRRRYWGVEQDEYWWKVASERTRAA